MGDRRAISRPASKIPRTARSKLPARSPKFEPRPTYALGIISRGLEWQLKVAHIIPLSDAQINYIVVKHVSAPDTNLAQVEAVAKFASFIKGDCQSVGQRIGYFDHFSYCCRCVIGSGYNGIPDYTFRRNGGGHAKDDVSTRSFCRFCRVYLLFDLLLSLPDVGHASA